MKQANFEKNKFLGIVLFLLVFAIGIGYAILTETLTISNTVNYDSMKWNIGFTSTSDNGGSKTSIPSISSDKKSINISCDLGTSVSSETCIAKATITNDSTFNIMLEAAPTITYNDTYINSVDIIWLKSSELPKQFDGIKLNNSEDIQIKVTTKELEENMLPEESISISITITMNWIEANGSENFIVPLIGREITLGDEKFNIISDNDETITILAKYNLGENYKQSNIEKDLSFSNNNGWEYTPGPKDIDVMNYDGNVKNYLTQYHEYLATIVAEEKIEEIRLITLKELKKLGCQTQEDYSMTGNETCQNSEHKDWLINGQFWWTESAEPSDARNIWLMYSTGFLNAADFSYSTVGIRPVITINKNYPN